jgi:hypothetical protein
MPFGSLWLAVVVAAVAVFIASSIVHMVLKYHRADYKKLSDEEAARQGISKSSPPPGVYVMPYCVDMAQMKDPAMLKKYEDGPVAILTVLRNGPPNMGKHLSQWFLFCLLVSFVVSYIARHCLLPGADPMEIFRITATVAFIAYGFGSFVDSIWKGIPWSNSLRGLLDALIYCLVTGAVFVWLWPAA